MGGKWYQASISLGRRDSTSRDRGLASSVAKEGVDDLDKRDSSDDSEASRRSTSSLEPKWAPTRFSILASASPYSVGPHLNRRAGHLVAVAGGAMTVLFVLSHDLGACILAHTLVDAVAVALMPGYLRRWAKVPL